MRAIRSLPFRHGAKPQLGFEMFRLAELYARADRRAIDHALETPQRPEFHTIYVGLRGKGSLVVDFTKVPLGAGQLTFVARGRVQQFVVERHVDAWMLLIAPELVASPVLSPLWNKPALAVPAAERAALMAHVAVIETEHARAFDAQQPAILEGLVRAFVGVCERLVACRVSLPTGPLERFFTILDRDHLETRAVSHYAREAGISARRLGELLGTSVGKSTKQVIDERVILELKRLLVHTTLSVKELADRAGFDEPTNLVKFFRHHTGTTPQAFRDAHRTILPSGRRS